MKVVALIVGIALLALGIAGFVPSLVHDGLLFGTLPANPVMCGLFVVTGLAGIVIGLSHRRALVPPTSSGQDMRGWM